MVAYQIKLKFKMKGKKIMVKKILIALVLLGAVSLVFAASPMDLFTQNMTKEAKNWGFNIAFLIMLVITAIECYKFKSLWPAIWAIVGVSIISVAPSLTSSTNTNNLLNYFSAFV